ncbi:MAG: hypothetical protein JWM11_965, partial [Planctomycetaceae bacterium]|nr:hypothetical protein [Planctomycetaceae bacterium]
RQKLDLSRLGDAGLALRSLQTAPHLASLLATTTSADSQRNILKYFAVDVAITDRPAVLNAYLRESGRHRTDRLTEFFEDHLELGLEIQHKGLIGAEVLLLGSQSTLASAGMADWMADILKMGHGEDLDDFLSYFALFVSQGGEIATRMAAEPDFSRRFLNDLWPQFKKLTRRVSKGEENSGPTVAHLMSEPAVWRLLADPDGGQLITEFGLVPVVLMYDDQPFPSRLHPRIRALLKSRNEILIKSLLDRDLRSNPDFIALLGRQVEIRILATAIYQAQQSGSPEQIAAQLHTFASQSDAHLSDQLSPLESPTGILTTIPQGIYLEVGLNLLSGQSVRSRKWQKLTRTAVLDALTLATKYPGVAPVILKRIRLLAGITCRVMDGMDDVRDQKLKDTQQKANRPLRVDEKNQLVKEAEPEILHSQKFIQALELIRSIISRQSDGTLVDLTPSVLFFSDLTPDDLRSPKIVDWRQVAVYELPDRRALIGFRTDSPYAQEHPRIAQFFNERVELVRKHFDAPAGTQTMASADVAEVAWRESVSAWWLLAASGDLPTTNWLGN